MKTRQPPRPDAAHISATALADFVAGRARQGLSPDLPARNTAAARGRADHQEHHRRARRFR